MFSKLTHRFAFVVAVTVPALIAFAADPGAAAEKVEAVPTLKQGLYSAVTTLVVFAIVFAILATKVWPVITKALDERANKIRDEIESAESARKQAKAALDDYQKSLADARAEAQQMLDKTRAQQNALAAELKAKADAELAAMRERAMKDIENAKRAAVNELYNHSANLAADMAGKILRRQVTAGDQQRLIEESLEQLGARN